MDTRTEGLETETLEECSLVGLLRNTANDVMMVFVMVLVYMSVGRGGEVARQSLNQFSSNVATGALTTLWVQMIEYGYR